MGAWSPAAITPAGCANALLRRGLLLLRLVQLFNLLGDPLVALGARILLLVHVGQQILHGWALRFHAAGRHVGLGDPDNRVEDGLAEIILGPIPMDVATGASETTLAVVGGVLIFSDPDHRLGQALTQPGAHIGVTAVGIVFLIPRA